MRRSKACQGDNAREAGSVSSVIASRTTICSYDPCLSTRPSSGNGSGLSLRRRAALAAVGFARSLKALIGITAVALTRAREASQTGACGRCSGASRAQYAQQQCARAHIALTRGGAESDERSVVSVNSWGFTSGVPPWDSGLTAWPVGPLLLSNSILIGKPLGADTQGLAGLATRLGGGGAGGRRFHL
jgi:hypothetical protein